MCVGQVGIVFNFDKFQFVERSVDFVGFRVFDSIIEFFFKYLDVIKDFFFFISIIDIRSWFGFVNQVFNYVQLCDFMVFFKLFFSFCCKFLWFFEFELIF